MPGRCSDPFGPSQQKCSCSDCPDVCLPLEAPLLPPEPHPFTVGRYDGMLVVSMLLFVLLSTAVLSTFFLKSHRRKISFEGGPSGACRQAQLQFRCLLEVSKQPGRWPGTCQA